MTSGMRMWMDEIDGDQSGILMCRSGILTNREIYETNRPYIPSPNDTQDGYLNEHKDRDHK